MNAHQKAGKLAAKRIKDKYGKDFFKTIGAKGGTISRGGGFTNDPDRAREAGKLGGRLSKPYSVHPNIRRAVR